jgi:hypothetical protein
MPSQREIDGIAEGKHRVRFFAVVDLLAIDCDRAFHDLRLLHLRVFSELDIPDIFGETGIIFLD